jgi:hypothetical protein
MKTTLLLILIIGFMFTSFLFISPNMANAQRETIGRWIVDDYPGLKGSTLEIYKKGKKFYLYWKFGDGSKGTYELTRRGKAAFFMIDSATDDYFVTNRINHLELRDAAGLITTARPIK